jgi:hypothetical protein
MWFALLDRDLHGSILGLALLDPDPHRSIMGLSLLDPNPMAKNIIERYYLKKN